MNIGNLAVYKATGIWIVRDRTAHKELAHCPTKREAIAVAKHLSA